MSKLLKIFGKNVSRELEERGWMNVDLADKMKMDHGQFSKYLKGESNINLLTLERFANALNVPAAELLREQPHSIRDCYRRIGDKLFPSGTP